jgi:membrane-bound lytic murein transglycosylase D
MTYRLSVALVVSGCIFSLLGGCGLLAQHESACPKTSDRIASAHPDIPPQPVNPPKCELPIPEHRSIQAAVARFSNMRHRSFQIQLDRACDYVVPAQQIFRKNGLPPDLVYVALVESGFVPKAKSRAKAVGMWQIIPTTACRLGLRENHWIDERCDPMKSAQAAADYLSRLYGMFGNWPLALAAYNAGENGVRQAMAKSGLKTYWELSEAGWLPAETRAYVPRVYAAVIIARSPGRYGFWYRPEHYVAKYEKVVVPGGVKLAWVGKKIGVAKDELVNCNPELCKPVTPPCCSEYELCVPVGCRDSVISALASCPPCKEAPRQEKKQKLVVIGKLPTPAVHKVGHGESWSSLARRYKCPAKTLAAMNHTRTSSVLKLGQSLQVPPSSAVTRLAVTSSGKHASKALLLAESKRAGSVRRTAGKVKKPAGRKAIHYKISQGDTLWTIAERFHVPVKTLCTQNALRPNQKIRPGAHIAIYADQAGYTRIAERRQ